MTRSTGPLIQAIERHRVVQRRLDLTSSGVSIEPVEQGDVVDFDGRTLVTVHGHRLRLLIVGGGQLSRYLAAMAVMLDYDVTVCDPREQYHEGWSSMEGGRLSREIPDDEVISMGLDGSRAVVTVTHDPKLDDLGLMEALKTSAFCVAAIGSSALLQNDDCTDGSSTFVVQCERHQSAPQPSMPAHVLWTATPRVEAA